jgi:hypothetical protein
VGREGERGSYGFCSLTLEVTISAQTRPPTPAAARTAVGTGAQQMWAPRAPAPQQKKLDPYYRDPTPVERSASDSFRVQLGAAIDSVKFVKRALDTQVPENDRGEALNTAWR